MYSEKNLSNNLWTSAVNKHTKEKFFISESDSHSETKIWMWQHKMINYVD